MWLFMVSIVNIPGENFFCALSRPEASELKLDDLAHVLRTLLVLALVRGLNSCPIAFDAACFSFD